MRRIPSNEHPIERKNCLDVSAFASIFGAHLRGQIRIPSRAQSSARGPRRDFTVGDVSRDPLGYVAFQSIGMERKWLFSSGCPRAASRCLHEPAQIGAIRYLAGRSMCAADAESLQLRHIALRQDFDRFNESVWVRAQRGPWLLLRYLRYLTIFPI